MSQENQQKLNALVDQYYQLVQKKPLREHHQELMKMFQQYCVCAQDEKTIPLLCSGDSLPRFLDMVLDISKQVQENNIEFHDWIVLPFVILSLLVTHYHIANYLSTRLVQDPVKLESFFYTFSIVFRASTNPNGPIDQLCIPVPSLNLIIRIMSFLLTMTKDNLKVQNYDILYRSNCLLYISNILLLTIQFYRSYYKKSSIDVKRRIVEIVSWDFMTLMLIVFVCLFSINDNNDSDARYLLLLRQQFMLSRSFFVSLEAYVQYLEFALEEVFEAREQKVQEVNVPSRYSMLMKDDKVSKLITSTHTEFSSYIGLIVSAASFLGIIFFSLTQNGPFIQLVKRNMNRAAECFLQLCILREVSFSQGSNLIVKHQLSFLKSYAMPWIESKSLQQFLDQNETFTEEMLKELWIRCFKTSELIITSRATERANCCYNPSCSFQGTPQLQKSRRLQIFEEIFPEIKPEIYKCCSSCHLVSYCSKECQKNDWSKHRLICKETKKIVEEALK